VDELKARMAEGLPVLDVRRKGEWASGHITGAIHVPLDVLERDRSRLDPGRPLAVVCAGGYRSSAACSLLEGWGFAELYNVVGGTSAWVAAGYPAEAHAS
jgi:hydroxyacylglutathione hydrolase